MSYSTFRTSFFKVAQQAELSQINMREQYKKAAEILTEEETDAQQALTRLLGLYDDSQDRFYLRLANKLRAEI